MRIASRLYSVTAAIFVVGLSLAPRAQVREHGDVPREQWQRVQDVFNALGVGPGSHVADVGAGQGYFTTRLAKVVGESGRVYAVDVNPISLRELKESLGAGVTNVEIVRGDENDPHLPTGRLDAILIVNAYHEFAEYSAMLRQLHAALRPGGRLVIIEPIPRAADTTRAAQTKRHALDIALAEADLDAAGFDVVTKDVEFIVRPDHMAPSEREGAKKATDWLLVARRRERPQPLDQR